MLDFFYHFKLLKQFHRFLKFNKNHFNIFQLHLQYTRFNVMYEDKETPMYEIIILKLLIKLFHLKLVYQFNNNLIKFDFLIIYFHFLNLKFLL
jgi:hypothetical protein